MSKGHSKYSGWRRAVVMTGAVGCALVLGWRAVDLQVLSGDSLRSQGDARHLRIVTMPAQRGIIADRNGEPLAISTPVDSVWANPSKLLTAADRLEPLARILKIDAATLRRRLEERASREFVYLRRHVSPALSNDVMALDLPGVALQRESRRYYPAGEVAGHVVGFTDIDDVGQEGLELAYDSWLRGKPGSKRVMQDRHRRIIEDVERIEDPVPGRDLVLSIDRRIQYLAYRELKAAVKAHNARGGSVVVLDAHSGEILAMVNQPAFNPNSRENLKGYRYRNRAVTDLFEPGSTIKPFTIAAALESGKYNPRTVVDTSPGYFRVANSLIQDIRNYGSIDLTTVIQKSSNVGASKIALALEPEQLWNTFSKVGLGAPVGTGFPSEQSGVLMDFHRWGPVERATMAYGYGVSVTALQLARAYAVLADGGVLKPISFQKLEVPPVGRRVMRAENASRVVAMMESVVGEGGTGVSAGIAGYRVAGKTGTVRKLTNQGYTDRRYQSLFAGVAPASRPRLVGVVIVDEPAGDAYYGGEVAAPVFASVIAGALRLMDIAPDHLEPSQMRLAAEYGPPADTQVHARNSAGDL